MNHYTNPSALNAPGYEIHYTRYADSILNAQFPEAKKDLEEVLNNFYVHESQIIEGGGGRSAIAQSLEELLTAERWLPKDLETKLYLEGTLVGREVIGLDHYKHFPKGGIGLKIQWNSKDSVFYSNLEDLKKLHNVSGLGLGIVVTRGNTLQEELSKVYQRFLKKQLPLSAAKLAGPLSLSQKNQRDVENMILKDKDGAMNAIAMMMTTSKFGTSTTHMAKLFEKIEARAGDPCPLILIGIGKDRLKP